MEEPGGRPAAVLAPSDVAQVSARSLRSHGAKTALIDGSAARSSSVETVPSRIVGSLRIAARTLPLPIVAAVRISMSSPSGRALSGSIIAARYADAPVRPSTAVTPTSGSDHTSTGRFS